MSNLAAEKLSPIWKSIAFGQIARGEPQQRDVGVVQAHGPGLHLKPLTPIQFTIFVVAAEDLLHLSANHCSFSSKQCHLKWCPICHEDGGFPPTVSEREEAMRKYICLAALWLAATPALAG